MRHGQNLGSASGEPEFVAQYCFEILASDDSFTVDFIFQLEYMRKFGYLPEGLPNSEVL
jgi:hypothetical protein